MLFYTSALCKSCADHCFGSMSVLFHAAGRWKQRAGQVFEETLFAAEVVESDGRPRRSVYSFYPAWPVPSGTL